MLARLAFLFIVVPIVELALLLLLAKVTNVAFTILLVLSTGLLGVWLAKQQGFAALGRIRDDLRRGRMPGAAVVDAVLIVAAAALLLTPGVLTDVAALSLLFPPTRRRYREWLVEWLSARFRIRTRAAGEPPRRTEIIDSYVIEGAHSAAPYDVAPKHES